MFRAFRTYFHALLGLLKNRLRLCHRIGAGSFLRGSAISTSGNSPNVVQAASEARQRGLRVIALTGRTGGNLAQAADLLLAVPSDDTARTQEVHILCLHALAESVEAELKDLP